MLVFGERIWVMAVARAVWSWDFRDWDLVVNKDDDVDEERFLETDSRMV